MTQYVLKVVQMAHNFYRHSLIHSFNPIFCEPWMQYIEKFRWFSPPSSVYNQVKKNRRKEKKWESWKSKTYLQSKEDRKLSFVFGVNKILKKKKKKDLETLQDLFQWSAFFTVKFCW